MSDVSEPVVEAPAVEAPAAVEPAAEVQPGVVGAPENQEPNASVPEAPATTPSVPEAEDPFHEFGGREEIESAHRLWQATQTDDGVARLFFEAGQAMGLGLKEMQALFGGSTPETPAAAVDERDPDEPLTWGEFQAMTQAQQQAEIERQATQIRETAKATVQATVSDLGLDPADPSTKVVLQYADQHMKDDFSPEAIKTAIRQGHADYQAAVQQSAEKYLQTKAAQADGVPSAPSGAAAPAEPAPSEPKNTAEAALIVRRRLGLVR